MNRRGGRRCVTADYYTQFSEWLTLENKEQEDWVRAELADPTKNIPDGADGPLEYEAYLKKWTSEHKRIYSDDVEPDYWPGFAWEIEPDGLTKRLWVHDDGGCGNLEVLSVFAKRFMEKFNPTGHWGLSWADTCSKPRIGEFGGGAFVVTAKRIKWFMITQEMNKYIRRISRKAKVQGKKKGGKKKG